MFCEEVGEIIGHCFTEVREILKKLFSRLPFNILCVNTDGCARNHAVFWDGKRLSLRPDYNFCPLGRAENDTGQAMRIIRENNLS